ncbi:MAG: dihydrolipoamide acetyltransferase family protein [Caldilineaceae bacterium]
MAASTTTQVLMPKLGESVVEGTVARWLKNVGERVEKLEPLLEISTDKIDTEIPSPASGLLIETRVPEGTTVAVGTVLALIAGDAGATVQRPLRDDHERTTSVEVLSSPPPNGIAARTQAAPAGVASGATPPAPKDQSAGSFVSPVVRRLMAEHQVDLALIAGSGLAGRVTKQDVLDFLAGQATAQTVVDSQPQQAQSPIGADEALRPLTTMRRAIAQHMVKSKQTAPHVTTIFEVDMSAVVRHREAHKQAATAGGPAPTLTAYFVWAAAQALRAFPAVNSRFSEQGIVESRRVHVGVAVSLPAGLLVPVIRNADELSLADVAQSVADLALRARSGRLNADEVTGGTFTITNHGMGGSLIGTPIIAQPQSAILGVGAVVKRPVVVSLGGGAPSLLPGPDDAIVIRPMAYLSLSFDHRLLDGAAADAFVAHIRRTLEGWPPP